MRHLIDQILRPIRVVVSPSLVPPILAPRIPDEQALVLCAATISHREGADERVSMRHSNAAVVGVGVVAATGCSDRHDVTFFLALNHTIERLLQVAVGSDLLSPVLEDGHASQRAETIDHEACLRMGVLTFHLGPSFFKHSTPNRLAV